MPLSLISFSFSSIFIKNLSFHSISSKIWPSTLFSSNLIKKLVCSLILGLINWSTPIWWPIVFLGITHLPFFYEIQCTATDESFLVLIAGFVLINLSISSLFMMFAAHIDLFGHLFLKMMFCDVFDAKEGSDKQISWKCMESARKWSWRLLMEQRAPSKIGSMNQN